MIYAGRFIVATNVLKSTELSNDKMITEYKAQQSCERGFGFLKDPLFFTDSIFIKSPERIEALAMIMGLCLLVYTLAQRQIRARNLPDRIKKLRVDSVIIALLTDSVAATNTGLMTLGRM